MRTQKEVRRRGSKEAMIRSSNVNAAKNIIVLFVSTSQHSSRGAYTTQASGLGISNGYITDDHTDIKAKMEEAKVSFSAHGSAKRNNDKSIQCSSD